MTNNASTSKSIDISRDQSLIMRGMAIVMIALHNYCHWMPFAVSENESSFSKEQTLRFFGKVMTFSDEWVYNIFSFLGWYGVPIFIFLTGFGLVRKYETEGHGSMNKQAFLYDNWFKLLALILPGVICYVALDVAYFIFSGNTGWLSMILTHILNLTFLNDILGPWINFTPGVYWYFGLTLEFYFLYAYAVYKRPVSILLWITLGSIALQAAAYFGILGNHELMLWWVRQNFTGWMLPFAFAIIYARTKAIPTVGLYVIIIGAIILFFPVMIDQSLWQLSLLCAIVLMIAASRISLKIPYWRVVWIYIGRLSPFIFAAHPLVRTFIFDHLSPRNEPDAAKFILYIAMVMICSIFYKLLWKYTTPALKTCIYKAESMWRNIKKR